ncbi:MAG: PAS domain S-box protein [Cyclobacteriaceae bacterium]
MKLESKTKKELLAIIRELQQNGGGSGNGRIDAYSFEYYLSQGEMLVIGIDHANSIKFVNSQTASFLGSDDLYGKDFLQIFGLNDNRIVHEIIYQQQQKDSFLATYKPNNDRYVIRFKSFIKDPAGLLYFFGDIESSHQHNIQLLKNATKPYIDLLNKSRDLIQVFTYEGKIRYINNFWKKKLGYSDSELKKLDLKDLVAPEYYEITKQKLFDIANNDINNRLVTTFVTKNNKKINLSGFVYCNKRGGKIIDFRGIFHDITEQIRAEKAQSLYYSIANLTIHSINIETFFANIHEELKKVIEATNFYVALVNEENHEITFPYLKDELIESDISPESVFIRNITKYAIHKKTPLFLFEKDIKNLNLNQKIIIKDKGKIPKVYIGVPLILENRIIGIIAVQSYYSKDCYTINDLELLDFISGQIALSIERKHKEERLNSQNARINAIIENGSHLVWAVDRELLFTSYNQNFKNLFTALFHVTPDNYNLIADEIKIPQADLFRESYRKAFSGEPCSFELELVTNDDKGNWWEVFLNPIISSNEEIYEVSGIAHNITQKKRSELALQESEEKFRNIFESFQDIYFRCNLSGEIVVVSPSIEELTGYTPETVVGKNITDYYLYSSKTKHLIRQLIKQKGVRNFEASIIANDGTILNCICNVRLVTDPKNQPAQIEGVVRDITKLKETNVELVRAKEMAERSVKVKESFLANMSHEIRTPMNGVIGMIDLLSGTNLDEEQQNYIHTIKKSSETLLHILNDILDLSKIEAGKMQVKKAPVRIKRVMEKLYAMFSQQAMSKNTNLYYHIDPNLPEYVLTDETRLLQILSNLTSNAIKFTDGGGAIDVGIKPFVNEAGHSIKFDVSDSGIGISQENLEKLFMSFNQIDNSTSKAFGGTGLGLAISKALCKILGGEIGVYSTPGLGSTFWFTIQAPPASGDQIEDYIEQEEDIEIKNFFKNKSPYILLVDDNIVNRQVAGEILKKAGCMVDMAESGFVAIEKAIKNRYDLILMDIQMPEMDGVMATNKIKNLGLKQVPPIVAMTAYSMKEDRDRFMNQGLDDYIAKPLRANELILKVQSWVSFEPLTLQQPIASNGTNKEKIVNEEVIDQLMKYGSDDMVIKVFDDFEIETKEQLEISIAALLKKDYENIRSQLHTLKGNAGTLGVEKVAKYAEYIEANLKKSNFETLEQDLKFLKLTFAEFQNNYKEIINQLTK